ncbi:macrolide ABC transporter ATP-binding protein, partial [Eggerthia catenaformis]
MTSSPLIEFRQVSKVYGQGEAAIRALDHVDLAINAHEFVAIMGPSGSGKSTAMNILGCLDVPSGGDYIFQGIPTSGFDRGQLTLLRRHMLGFVFQSFNLLPRLNALDNVALPLSYRGMPRREALERAEAMLARVGLAERAGHR